jgi:hypothetical protein
MTQRRQYGYGTRRTPGGNDGYTGKIDIAQNKYGFTDPYERWRSLNDYMDYTGWKRQELQNLMKAYRTQFPKQMAAYQQAAMGELGTRSPQVWGQMHTNLQQRGLDDSTNFVAGARQDFDNWRLNEKQSIFDTKSNIQNQAQQALLAAVGRPDFAGVYQGWNTLTQQLNDYIDNYRMKLKKKVED